MNTNSITQPAAQLLVSVTDPTLLNKLKNAIKMLNGVGSISIIKEPKPTKAQKQQAYVKQTLTKALQEVKLAKLEGRKLQSLDNFLDELDQND